MEFSNFSIIKMVMNRCLTADSREFRHKYQFKLSFVIFDGQYWFSKEKGWLKEIIHHFFVIFAPKFNNMSDICRISISDDSFVHFSVKIISAPKKIKNNFDKKTKSFEILNSKIEKIKIKIAERSRSCWPGRKRFK